MGNRAPKTAQHGGRTSRSSPPSGRVRSVVAFLTARALTSSLYPHNPAPPLLPTTFSFPAGLHPLSFPLVGYTGAPTHSLNHHRCSRRPPGCKTRRWPCSPCSSSSSSLSAVSSSGSRPFPGIWAPGHLRSASSAGRWRCVVLAGGGRSVLAGWSILVLRGGYAARCVICVNLVKGKRGCLPAA